MANAVVPVPRVAVSVRLATLDDLPFMDDLQSQYPKQLGHFKTEWFEGYIKTNGVLVAESEGRRIGYVISRDRYQKRDELGVIFQLCVAPGVQRKLVGAELIKAVFDRSAYGCKLYCCWCAQDIDANYFWESVGFVPIAFRAGSRTKGPKGSCRVHIFWQRRIRERDIGERATPYWFPSQTSGGAIAEDRLVLPIPPGTHWSEVKPVILPGEENAKLEGPAVGAAPARDRSKRALKSKSPIQTKPAARQFVLLGPPPPVVPQQGQATAPAAPAPAAEPAQKPKKPARAKRKHDPVHIAKARELRDRSVEYFNANPSALQPAGKYDVSRALPAPAVPATTSDAPRRFLPAA